MWKRVAILGALVLAAVPAAARASTTQESLLQDDDMLLHAPPKQVEATFDELRALGIERVRLSVIWRNLAPQSRPSSDLGDPRYYPAGQFDAIDHAVRAAHRRGIEVLFNVRGGAPDWALGKRPKRMAGRDGYKPSVAEFGRFVTMLGRRYDGKYADENQGGRPLPRVTAWSVWNEPNWSGHLQPQSVRVRLKGRRSRLQTVSPRWYRGLYRAAAQALQATGHGEDILLIGETAPVGNRKMGELSHLRPLRFLRDLFCLDRGLRPLRGVRAKRLRCDFDRRGPLPATGYAHHPYSVTQAPDKPSRDPENVMLADSARLERLLDAATLAGRIPALPLWYTEFGYQTSPPDPLRGIPLETHAQWLSQAERLTWGNPRVAAMTQFLLRDDEPRTNYPEGDRRRWVTYQTGLEFDDGRHKPAYAAYRMPLMAEPGGLWGMVRPGQNGAELRIQVQYRAQDTSAWQTLGERSVTDQRGYFVEPVDRSRPGFYRVKWLRPQARSWFAAEPEGIASPAVYVAP